MVTVTDKATTVQAEALERAQAGGSTRNYPAIFAGFMAKGIARADIDPRENVLTFQAWRALGRTVRRGEHGVKVVTIRPMIKKTTDDDGVETEKRFSCPWTATVFHVSQTDAFTAKNGKGGAK